MTTQSSLKLLPPPPPRIDAPAAPVVIPTSIVCKSCKEETGFTPETIMEQAIDAHICCPICSHVIYSCLPEKPIYTSYTHSTHTNIYDNYD